MLNYRGPKSPVAELCELLKPAPNDFLAAVAVSLRVNTPKNDDPECIEAIPAGGFAALGSESASASHATSRSGR